MIAIDRLVLDVPGLDPARAERIALRLGPLLPALSAGTRTGDDIAIDRLAIDLPPGALDDETIAAALARALAARIA